MSPTHVYILEDGEDYEGFSVRGVFNTAYGAGLAMSQYKLEHKTVWEPLQCNEVDCIIHYKSCIDNVRIKRYVVT